MTLIKDIDAYIITSKKLLTTNPSATVTLSYTHSKSGKSIIKFKSYDSKHGLCYSFTTRKQKEFSKLCNALGPRGCIVGEGEIDGLSLLLMNTKKSEVVPVEPVTTNTTPAADDKKQVPAQQQQPQKQGGGKKKKKGKKH